MDALQILKEAITEDDRIHFSLGYTKDSGWYVYEVIDRGVENSTNNTYFNSLEECLEYLEIPKKKDIDLVEDEELL